LLSSYSLPCSPSRTVRPVPRYSLHITSWGNSLFSVIEAPCNFSHSHTTGTRGPGLAELAHLKGIAMHTQLLDSLYLPWLHGADRTHHLWLMHTRARSRRAMSLAFGSGAAAPDAFTGKARSRVHGHSNRPHHGPQVLWNKTRIGIDKVRARSRSARRVK
jgi:hypothetical protein